MKEPWPFRIPLLLSLLVLIGLVGMLVAEGVWDVAFLLCATAPLAIGWLAWLRAAHTGNAQIGNGVNRAVLDD